MWIDDIYRDSDRLLDALTTDYVRDIYDSIHWEGRMVCLKGARGVGKTTMLLQRMKQCVERGVSCVYVSLDDLCFSAHRLLELVEYHSLYGGEYMFLDEVHRYPSENWAQELKNIYDKYPDMHIAFSGSSVLNIDSRKADLSRRCMFYDIPGLSFREFLEMEGVGKYAVCSLEDVLTHHDELVRAVVPKKNIIAHFERYLARGYYPIYKDENLDYYMALRQVVSTIIDTDLPAAYKLEYATLVKLKHLMTIIAHAVPFTVNVQRLGETIDTTRGTIIKMFDLLSKARLVNLLYSGKTKLQQLAKPEKVYLENPNLMYALSPSEVNTGTAREAFFANQVGWQHALAYSDRGDFIVDDRYTIEVGGARKTFDQIRDQPNSYLALDNAVFGHQNKIPLWLFGFLY